MSTAQSTTYEAPGRSGSPVELRGRYESFIGDEWIAPTTGEYLENLAPSMGERFCEVAMSHAAHNLIPSTTEPGEPRFLIDVAPGAAEGFSLARGTARRSLHLAHTVIVGGAAAGGLIMS